ncbi:hypothetical protein S83_006217, partial [Arachis hypogaea]
MDGIFLQLKLELNAGVGHIQNLKKPCSPFEKLIRGSKLKTLDGPEYVRKVSENCVAYMKSVETFGDAEEKAIHEFRQAFKDQNFLPGSTVFYEQFPNGTLGV